MTGEILPAGPDPRRHPGPDGIDGSPGPGNGGASGPGMGGSPGPEVGEFRQNALTAAALARYLVGRVLVERISISLYVSAGVLIALAVLLWFVAPHWVAVLVGLIGLVVLGFRALLLAVLRRLLAFGRFGPAEARVRELVSDSQGDMRRELKRIGLPSTVFTMPMLVPRLVGRRRRETLEAFGRFDVERVVPPHRRDEFGFIVRDAVRRPPA